MRQVHKVLMGQGKVLLVWSVMVGVAALAVGCGNSSGLHSLTISPATADAKNYPNGQVQFAVMGSYGGSSPAVAVKALWWNYTPWSVIPVEGVPSPTNSLTSNGLAACLGTGTFTVWATAPTNQSIPLSQMTAGTSQLMATAQLTCP